MLDQLVKWFSQRPLRQSPAGSGTPAQPVPAPQVITGSTDAVPTSRYGQNGPSESAAATGMGLDTSFPTGQQNQSPIQFNPSRMQSPSIAPRMSLPSNFVAPRMDQSPPGSDSALAGGYRPQDQQTPRAAPTLADLEAWRNQAKQKAFQDFLNSGGKPQASESNKSSMY